MGLWLRQVDSWTSGSGDCRGADRYSTPRRLVLCTKPASREFYALTFSVAGTWLVGGLTIEPLRWSSFRGEQRPLAKSGGGASSRRHRRVRRLLRRSCRRPSHSGLERSAGFDPELRTWLRLVGAGDDARQRCRRRSLLSRVFVHRARIPPPGPPPRPPSTCSRPAPPAIQSWSLRPESWEVCSQPSVAPPAVFWRRS